MTRVAYHADHDTASDIWERKQGCDGLYVPKSQREPVNLFAPMPNRSCLVHDDPREEGLALARASLGDTMRNVLPFEQERVAPIRVEDSIGIGAPKRMEDLYADGSSAARYTHEIPFAAPPMNPTSATYQQIGDLTRESAPRSYELGVGDGTRASGAVAGRVLHGAVDAKETERETTSCQHIGTPVSQVFQHQGYETDGIDVPGTNRAELGWHSRLGTPDAVAGAARGADPDSPEPTRREWLVLHPRQFGALQAMAEIPEKAMLGSDDLPRTTGRETLVHDTIMGVAKGEERQPERPDDGARRTGRQTLPVGEYLMNLDGSRWSVLNVDLDALRRDLGVTMRETLTREKRTGNVSLRTFGGYVRTLLGLSLAPTKKDATSGFGRMGVADGSSHAPAARRQGRWWLNPLRDILSWRRSPTPEGDKVTVGAEDINAELRNPLPTARQHGNVERLTKPDARATPCVALGDDSTCSDRLQPEFAAMQAVSNPVVQVPLHMQR